VDTVLIRQAEVDDAAALITYLREVTSDPHVNLLYDPGEFCLTVEQERAFILQRRDGSRGLLLVAEADGRIIGVAGADRKPCRAERHVVVLGLSVLEAYRGRGLGTQLLGALLDWCREQPGVRRIELSVYARNTVAIALYRKHGFQLEGRRREAVRKGGEWLDVLVMGQVLAEPGEQTWRSRDT